MPAAAEPILEALRRLGYVVTREQGLDAPSGPDFVRMQVPGTSHVVEIQGAKTAYQETVICRAVPMPELEAIRRREIREADNLKILALLESAFNHAVKSQPPRPSSGLIEMQQWFAKLRK